VVKNWNFSKLKIAPDYQTARVNEPQELIIISDKNVITINRMRELIGKIKRAEN